MKKTTVVLLFFLPVFSWGQSFDSIVDFNLELSSISDPAVVRKAVDNGRVLILEGLMGNTERIESGEEPGVYITLIGGEWIGTSEVRAYSCRIEFPGDEWIEVFSPDGEIPADSRLLVAVRLTGYNQDLEMPEGRMVSFRVLH